MSKSRKGFTLVEILTVVFLSVIIVVAAYSLYLISYKSYKKQTASAEITQNARVALERLSRELRQSPEIVTALPANFANGVSEIMFQDGHDVLTIPPPTCEYQYITYKLVDTNLIRYTSHFHLADQNICVKYNSNELQIEHKDPEQTKAEKIAKLTLWGTIPTVGIYLEASDGDKTYQFETKTTARNI